MAPLSSMQKLPMNNASIPTNSTIPDWLYSIFCILNIKGNQAKS